MDSKIWTFENLSDIIEFEKGDFDKVMIKKRLLDEGCLEEVMCELLDWSLIFRDFSSFEPSEYVCYSLTKIFNMMYPLILLAYKKIIELEEAEFNERKKFKSSI